jgi:2-oxo-4-hydroxy-4-carboxy-5-ureidoimidazoline decarboxylase
MTLDDLNHLDAASAERELLRCCGSTRWARQMTAARPFADPETMIRVSDQIWSSLDRGDWLEAFGSHPRIGNQTAAPAAMPRGLPRGISDRSRRGWGPGASAEKVDKEPRENWSANEQAGIENAPDNVLDKLAARNRDYEARFGYIFIVCATGKSADEMLSMLERRLTNEECRELGIAAEEQRKITNLRIAKLLT